MNRYKKEKLIKSYVTDEFYDFITEIAEKEQWSVSAIIRMALVNPVGYKAMIDSYKKD